MPVGLEIVLWVMGILGVCLGGIAVLVVIASKEEEPGEAEAYAFEMLNDDQLQALWQEEEKSDT